MIYNNGNTPVGQAEELEELARREAAGQPGPTLHPRRRYANGRLATNQRMVNEVPLGDSEAL